MSKIFSPLELFDLHGKRAAVIGGTGVLGGRIARCLAAAGAEVMVLGRSEKRGKAMAVTIDAEGGRALFLAIDVTDRDSLIKVAGELEAMGGIDILVNASGVNSTTPFSEISDEEWHRILDVNVGSIFRACQVFAAQMSNRSGGASIINISSSAAATPVSKVFTYGVSKAAVDNVTQYLAREMAPANIRVNAVVPGFFPAEQNRAILTQERVDSILGHTPMKRLGNPEELDGVVLWLASSRASGFVTGALVRVDGGFSAMTI